MFFYKISGKWGCFFVKKWSFPQRRVHYVQYRYFFILHFTYWGVRTPTHPPAYGSVVGADVRRGSNVRSHHEAQYIGPGTGLSLCRQTCPVVDVRRVRHETSSGSGFATSLLSPTGRRVEFNYFASAAVAADSSHTRLRRHPSNLISACDVRECYVT